MPTLECYPMASRPPDIVPGRPQRGWMDRFSERHPYRCLPMTMANSTGWEILCPVGFTAEWNGGPLASDIIVTGRPPVPRLRRLRQDPLLARRPHLPPGLPLPHAGGLVDVGDGAAQPHQGRHPAAGRPGGDRLAAVPLHHELDLHPAGQGAASPRASRSASSPWPRTARWRASTWCSGAWSADPDLRGQYEAWRKQRDDFNKALFRGEPEAVKAAWQRYYFRGELPEETGRQGPRRPHQPPPPEGAEAGVLARAPTPRRSAALPTRGPSAISRPSEKRAVRRSGARA